MSILPRFAPFRKLQGRDVNLILDKIQSALGPFNPTPIGVENLDPVLHQAVPAKLGAGSDPEQIASGHGPLTGVTSLVGHAGIFADPSVGDVLVSAEPTGISRVYTARVIQTIPQSINDDSKNVLFDTIVSDPFSEFSNSGGITTFNPVDATGLYLLHAVVKFDPGQFSAISTDPFYVGIGAAGGEVKLPQCNALSPPYGTANADFLDLSVVFIFHGVDGPYGVTVSDNFQASITVAGSYFEVTRLD